MPNEVWLNHEYHDSCVLCKNIYVVLCLIISPFNTPRIILSAMPEKSTHADGLVNWTTFQMHNLKEYF